MALAAIGSHLRSDDVSAIGAITDGAAPAPGATVGNGDIIIYSASATIADGGPPGVISITVPFFSAAGTAIVAKVGDATCETTSVFTAGGESRYAIDVPASEPTNSPDCGSEGSSVSFYVDGKKADQEGEWKNFDLNVLNLTVTTPPTPAPSDTGTGVGSSTSSTTLPLAAVLGIATLVLGLGGLALSRRR